MMFRDRWCGEFADEVAIVDPRVPRELARRVALQAHAINRSGDPRELAIVWLAWRKGGNAADLPVEAEKREADALTALFEHLGS